MSVSGYRYQCPRCRDLNRYDWPALMVHYRRTHRGIISEKALGGLAQSAVAEDSREGRAVL